MIDSTIASLDLEPIKIKLMDADEGPGWSIENVERIEVFYRQFLDMNKRYPEMSVVPNKDIDKFWHFHILDTEKYANDCRLVFGRFLHHLPYFGMRNEDDAKNLATAFDQALALVAQSTETIGSSPTPQIVIQAAQWRS